MVQHLTVSELKRETTNNRTTANESSTSTTDASASSLAVRLPVAVDGLAAEGGGSSSEPVSDDGASSSDEFEDTNDVIMEDDMFIREMPSRPQPLSKVQLTFLDFVQSINHTILFVILHSA